MENKMEMEIKRPDGGTEGIILTLDVTQCFKLTSIQYKL